MKTSFPKNLPGNPAPAGRLTPSETGRRGFTLTELLVVLALVALLGCLTLSATSVNTSTSQTLQCLENVRELTRAWAIYATDNQGWLPPNSDNGAYGNWLGGDMTGPGTYHDPTNWALLVNRYPSAQGPNAEMTSALGNYISTWKVCKCPADPSTFNFHADVMSTNQSYAPRVRSYSMNCAVGTQYNVKKPVTGPWLTGSYGANHPGNPFNTYGTLNSFTNPGPANTFVVLDEDPYSINDASFSSDCNLPDQLIDNPAVYHGSSGVFSFADGHAILKHWTDPRTSFVETKAGHPLGGTYPNNPDIEWLRLHTSAYGNGQPLPLSVPPSP